MQLIFGSLTPYLRQKRMLAYPLEFHLKSIVDFTPRSSSMSGPSSPSDDSDSGPDGNLDWSYGFRQGAAGPQLTAFPRRGRGGGLAGHARAGGGSTARGITTRQIVRNQPSESTKLLAAPALQKHFPKVDSNRHVAMTTVGAEFTLQRNTGVQDKTTSDHPWRECPARSRNWCSL